MNSNSASKKPCPNCNELLPERACFCMICGTSLSGDPTRTAAGGGTSADSTATELQTRVTVPMPTRLIPTGTRLGAHYTVDGVIGEGGMGAVYEATDHARDRTVAIKVLHASLMGDAGIRKRFMREARMMTRWSHPNVVAVYDLIEDEDILAFVMEHIDGPTLSTYLSQWGGQLPYSDVRLIFDGILSAMSAAHGRGIVHRDLKPQNILLRPEHESILPKVVDFGVAKVLEGTTYTMTGALLGSCRYMSPEQVQAQKTLDSRSDIYSLGVALYRTLTGRCPFEGTNHFSLMMAHVQQRPRSPSLYRPDIPEKLERLVLDALAKNPDDRPQSCKEFSNRLNEALAAVAPKPAKPSGPLREILTEADGSELVLIPAGTFQMTSARRVVYLDAFYMARRSVTNAQFQTFIEVTGYRPEDSQSARFLAHWRGTSCPTTLLEHPVVYVSWADAVAYCTWAGKRLPTESEWEKAARGTDGAKYPWGRDEPTPSHAHFGQARAGTVSVHDCPDGASPYGVVGMAGNVWEWCEDVDDPVFYLRGPDRNPRHTVQPGDDPHVVRGGSFMFDARALRTHARSSFKPNFRVDGVGFRCAQ